MASVEELLNTLCGGLRRFMHSTHKKDVVLGLSGGIDSAVVACIAAEALGPEHVEALVMPSPFSSRDSETDAFKLAVALDIHALNIPIGRTPEAHGPNDPPSVLAAFEALLHAKGYKVEGVTLENLQARLRAVLLMAHANERDALVLNTGNLSEALLGYCTLYGDSIGAVAPIGNVLKTDVYNLALYINTPRWSYPGSEVAGGRWLGGKVIPRNIIERAPSAELSPGQKDSDDLPPYDVLDPILRRYVEGMLAPNFTDMTAGEQDIVARIKLAKFKRDQSPPALPAPRCVTGGALS